MTHNVFNVGIDISKKSIHNLCFPKADKMYVRDQYAFRWLVSYGDRDLDCFSQIHDSMKEV